MKSLVQKVGALLPDLEARGQVYLFALGEREDVNRWDVILSANWSDTNYTAAVRLVADKLVARLEPSELAALSGVVVVPSTEPNIQMMPKGLEDVSPADETVIEMTLLGLEVRRAYIFKAQRPAEQVLVSSSLAVEAV